MILIVQDKEFRFTQSYNISTSYNTIASTFSIATDRQIISNLLSYSRCEILDDNRNLLLTGYLFAPDINVTPIGIDIKYEGYSLPGVLEDCTIPKSIYPLQFDNLNLREITEKLLDPFGIDFELKGDIRIDIEKKYKKVTTDPDKSVKQFLNELASQRNIYMTHNESGKLIYTRFNENALPVMSFVEGIAGLKKVTLKIQSQQMHSSITVLKQATKENPDSAEATIQNPYITGYRPLIKLANSGDLFDVDKAARNALSAELAFIQIDLDTTVYVKPGNTIELKAPSINLNTSTELFVQSATINATTKDTEIYSLSCVPVDVYTNNTPKSIFS